MLKYHRKKFRHRCRQMSW